MTSRITIKETIGTNSPNLQFSKLCEEKPKCRGFPEEITFYQQLKSMVKRNCLTRSSLKS